MDINTFSDICGITLHASSLAAFYGLHSDRIGYIKDGEQFNVRTDLANTCPSDLGDRAVEAIDSFGVHGVRVDSIECGPVITRINLVLPHGTRIKSVESLADDIAMQLRVKSVGFTKVSEHGVLAMDIPADTRKTVRLGNVHSDSSKGMALPLELGVSVTGEARSMDLAQSPHLLIAGQTGSGKSVCVNAIICSLLKNVSVSDFELLLVDPKGVELNSYKKLPNCINNKVLVSPGDSLDGLRWLCAEMDKRYETLTLRNHRNIRAYNEWVKTQPVGIGCAEKMRYIVCIVDEFADLMMTAGDELTAIVQRLAQKSRAVGIHLVLATQRPSTKVVTGDLKANLPCRIAFKVSSSVDSVTILGHGGAESLLGKGDMILRKDDGEERLHGVYVTDDEITLLTRIVYVSTVHTIVKNVDFASGDTKYSICATDVPQWVVETFGECTSRNLDAKSPSWLTTLVDANRSVWDNADGKLNFGIIACRMSKHSEDAESVIIPASKEMFDIDYSDLTFKMKRLSDILKQKHVEAVDSLIRLKTNALMGLGFNGINVRQARTNSCDINPEALYVREYA